MKRTLTALALFLVLSNVLPANADFLGLAPGDYLLTLNGSSSLCGGVNCTGTVHIGSPNDTGFDWSFTIGSDTFSFDGPTQNTAI